MAKFGIGDEVWSAQFSRGIPVRVTCPVCYGKRNVTLILGNGDSVELPCDYCGKGNLGVPTGYDTEYQTINDPEQIIIEGINVEIRGSGEKVEYRAGHRIYYDENLFSTREEAVLRSDELRKEYEESEKKRADYIKADVKKSFAWNAGYHLRNIKQYEKQIEYHKGKAKLCKEKGKKGVSDE